MAFGKRQRYHIHWFGETNGRQTQNTDQKNFNFKYMNGASRRQTKK